MNRAAPDPVSTEIRVAMVRKGLKQEDLANALGFSQASVSDRLLGKSEWRVSELRILADFLELPVADLLVGAA